MLSNCDMNPRICVSSTDLVVLHSYRITDHTTTPFATPDHLQKNRHLGNDGSGGTPTAVYILLPPCTHPDLFSTPPRTQPLSAYQRIASLERAVEGYADAVERKEREGTEC